MKTAAAAVLVGTMVLALLGCYWTTGSGSGELSLDLSGVAPKGTGYYGRVYLLANGVRFALRPDTEYVQVPLSPLEPTTVIVDGIPAGPVYTALVSIMWQEPEGWLYTEQWAESDPFTITPGKIVSVPFPQGFLGPEFYPVWNMRARNIRDVESDGWSNIYVADAQAVYPGAVSSGINVSTEGYSVPSGHTINSLTMGVDFSTAPEVTSQLWANTDRAILPLVDVAFGPPLTERLGSESVLDSGWGRAENWSDFLLFFRRAEGFGGTYIPDGQWSPSDWTWINIDSDRTLDLAVGMNPSREGGAQGLFVTTGGTIRVPETFLTGSSSTSLVTAPAPIRSLAAFDDDAAEQLYLGTENGAYRNDAWGAPDARYLEPETAGYPIRRAALERAWS